MALILDALLIESTFYGGMNTDRVGEKRLITTFVPWMKTWSNNSIITCIMYIVTTHAHCSCKFFNVFYCGTY